MQIIRHPDDVQYNFNFFFSSISIIFFLVCVSLCFIKLFTSEDERVQRKFGWLRSVFEPQSSVRATTPGLIKIK